jgi:hypothetical protein
MLGESIMSYIFNFFNQGWVGSLIGLTGFIYAIFTYKKSKIGSRLVAQMKSGRVIGRNSSTPDEIEIFYKGNKVKRVIKTNIILWNSGTKTIFGSNIVGKDPLRIEVSPEEEIISFNILKSTKSANEITITGNSKNAVNINFNYLDSNDGASIEVFHTDNTLNPNIKGTIIGMPKGAIVDKYGFDLNYAPNSYKLLFSKKFILSTAPIGLVGIPIFIFSRIPQYKGFIDQIMMIGNSLDTLYYSLLIVSVIYTFGPILMLYSNRRKYPKELLLDEFENDNKDKKIRKKDGEILAE